MAHDVVQPMLARETCSWRVARGIGGCQQQRPHQDPRMVEGVAVDGSQLVYLVLCVVPMGWTHALTLCQQLHEHLAEEAGCEPERRLRDREFAPDMRTAGSHTHL